MGSTMTARTAAPFADGALGATLLPFGESTMLPASAYTSDAVFAWEQRHLFAGSWTCVGRVGEVPAGDLSSAQEWHGWLFVNETGDAPPLAEHLGALDDLVAPYSPARLVRGAMHDYELAANWKVITENYHECYHCPLIHPELCQVSPPDSGDNYDLPGAWVGGSMDLRDGADTMSFDGHSDGLPIPGVDPRRVRYLGLLPNLLLSLHPDYVMTHRMTPLAPARTHVECAWYFVPPDGVDALQPSYAVDFWDRTNRQDWAACESVQRGLASPHFRPGPLAPAEDAVHQFVTLLARAYLTGALTGAGQNGPMVVGPSLSPG
jgi:glycine betaine catabolism A